jgi:hypothetical protein
MFFPESPRHLMETDREDEALKVLRKLHFNGSNEEYIQREYYEIKTTIAAEKAITVPGWGIMFTVPQWRTRLMYKALGIVGHRNLLVAGIYNCIGPLASTASHPCTSSV